MSKSKRMNFEFDREKTFVPKRKTSREKSKIQRILKNVRPDSLDELDELEWD